MVRVAVWNDRGKRREEPVIYEGDFRQYVKKDSYAVYFLLRDPITHECMMSPLYNFGRPIFMKDNSGSFEMGFIGENWEYDGDEKKIYKQRWDIVFGEADRGEDDIVIAETVSVAHSPKLYSGDDLIL
jgi:hypothetical protein